MLSRNFYKVCFSCLRISTASFLNSQVPLVYPISQAHTIVVRRQYEIKLPEFGEKAELEDRHNIYYIDKIENGPKELKVILTEDSEDFGVKGELITLPKHFGRRLISQDKAVYASPENIEEFATVHKKSGQTISGRRLRLWLQKQNTFICPYRYNVPWTLTAENLARCLMREHKLSVPPSAITLPDYPITNENVDPADEHEIKITINKIDSVLIKISVPNWEPSEIL